MIEREGTIDMKFPGIGIGRNWAAWPQGTRLVLESVMAVTASVLLARVFWLIAAPQDTVAAAVSPLVATQVGDSETIASADLSVLTRFNGFTRESATPTMMESIPETSLNLRLVGLRSVTGSESGSATVELPDGIQARFEPGDEILSGVRLDAIHPDRVLLRHGTGIEVLLLGNGAGNGLSVIGQPTRRNSTFAASQPKDSSASGLAVVTPPAPIVSPAALLADTSMHPETREGVVVGYKVAPKTADGPFSATGLMRDDMVLRVNNIPVEGLTPDRVYAELGSSQQISLDVVRQGAIVRIRLAPSERPGQ